MLRIVRKSVQMVGVYSGWKPAADWETKLSTIAVLPTSASPHTTSFKGRALSGETGGLGVRSGPSRGLPLFCPMQRQPSPAQGNRTRACFKMGVSTLLQLLLPLAAASLQPSPDFGVTVNGEAAFVYMATVPGPTGSGHMNASFVHVTLPAAAAGGDNTGSSGAPAHVQVTLLPEGSPTPTTAALVPRGSPAVTVGGGGAAAAPTLSFALGAPGHFILELGGSFNVTTLSTGLMVFVDTAEEEAAARAPSPGDEGVQAYFGPGVHTIPGSGVLALRNDSTVYLAAGAVVLGQIAGSNVRNVSVRGPGILAAAWLPGDALPAAEAACAHCGCPGTNAVHITNATDVRIEGITIVHATSWLVRLVGVARARVRGIRELGWRCNNDGVDIVSSQDVVVERSFIRSADDAIAVKGLDPSRDTAGVVVRDCLLFPHGNCMEIGFELWNDKVTNVTFERNVCLHQMMNAFSIHNGGHAAVSGVTYRDILLEGVLGPLSHDESYGYKLLDLQVSQGKYSGPDMARRGSISDVVYSNVTYRPNGLQWVASRMVGNSTAHAVDGVHFDGFLLNGTAVASLAQVGTLSNAFVRGVTFA